ncbi:hypothetical protein ACHAXA_000828 [Cyclostephanos tholiformis]|uniref:Transmembrane protein n=1 Tax=Cyclostephanos tholiformis TaxID=382380 RepID=A0ABD3RWQ2_9STRA
MTSTTIIMDVITALTDGSSWRKHNRDRQSSIDSSPTTSADNAKYYVIKFASMLIAWIFLVRLVNIIVECVARTFWSHPVPIDRARLPSKLPHPNPPGSAVPFDVPLFARSSNSDAAGTTTTTTTTIARDAGGGVTMTPQRVANLAAEYKGALYEERTMTWIDEHFRLKKTNLKYPYVDVHWNGWSSFYLETAPHIRNMLLSSMTVIFEHTINGLVLPLLYLHTRDEMYYLIALYGEVAYMTYASTLIVASYALGRDVSIEQMHVAVWPLLLAHHVATILLVSGCIYVEETAVVEDGRGGEDIGMPLRDLVCAVLLSMLGFTSTLHYLGQILDFSPLSQANAPRARLCNHVFCLLSQVVFRGIFWPVICYLSIVHCLGLLGVGAAAIVASMLLLFTLFNIDFVMFHVKATRACWMKIRRDEVGKNS